RPGTDAGGEHLRHHRPHQRRTRRLHAPGRAERFGGAGGRSCRVHHGDRQGGHRRKCRDTGRGSGRARVLSRRRRGRRVAGLPRRQALQAPQAMVVMKEAPPPALPEATLPQMLRRRAQTDGERIAILQKDFGIWKPLTWREYHDRASRFGLGLRALGLASGGHVGVLSENRVRWVLAQMGAGLVGAVTVGVYPTSPAPEVAYVLGHADVEIVVCEDQEQTDKVLSALDQLPRLRKIVV